MTTMHCEFWDELKPSTQKSMARDGIQLTTDRFGLLEASSMLTTEFQSDPTKQPGFEAIVKLVRAGSLWVKLRAPCRVSEQQPDHEDLRFLVGAFLAANPHQILWGSDWPHTPRMKVRTHDEAVEGRSRHIREVGDEAWLRSLRSWLSEEECDLVVIQKPAKLFG